MNSDNCRDIDDYSLYKQGDTEPCSGKKIQILIACDVDYIVFLDEEFNHQWSVTSNYEDDDYPYSPLYGEVVNRVTELEGISASFPLPLERRKESRILIGSAIARMLERERPQIIRQMLSKAKTNLNDRMTETARLWYLQASIKTTLVTTIASILLWLFRKPIQEVIDKPAFDILLGSILGSIGALLSVLSRSTKISVNSSAGKGVHEAEGAMRIVIGILAALLVALAVKSNIILGLINTSGSSLALLLTACIVAGASERIAPGIIKQVEGLVGEKTIRETRSTESTTEIEMVESSKPALPLVSGDQEQALSQSATEIEAVESSEPATPPVSESQERAPE